ncbi:hypothetical protein cce_1464 [Crocosphaera subtropica ATCC 51142]|uniref:Uncharacterized protein n=1 Tax=Crocosphaera subtropica (strain ATCC 51142 / BH68) TaxID=43989 RepID=B1WX70_CROS5|nr:hypothetical protein [Crocosphaera subtropica]ACB50814.1 hypothetical protein cce_1464 [Crocosphaera subtropica ATCC 51142]
MLERLLLASTVTWLLYLSLQLGESPMTPNTMNQTATHVPIEQLESPSHDPNFGDFTVAQK